MGYSFQMERFFFLAWPAFCPNLSQGCKRYQCKGGVNKRRGSKTDCIAYEGMKATEKEFHMSNKKGD